jgi:hypothetical protein
MISGFGYGKINQNHSTFQSHNATVASPSGPTFATTQQRNNNNGSSPTRTAKL